MTTKQTPEAKAAIKRGNAVLRRRRELKALDEVAVVRLVAKYRGMTPGEAKRWYRHSFSSGLDRAAIHDAIIHVEYPR